MEKTCKTCLQTKPLEYFYKSLSNKDGLNKSCKECVKNKVREYKKNNKEKIKIYKEKYRLLNKDKINNRRRSYSKNKKAQDPLYKMICNIRSRTSKIFRDYDNQLSNIKMLGCSKEEARRHIEDQFIGEMSWDNYGEWHVDHIIPLSSAKTKEDLINLSHYTNLQPLWALDNLKKSNKIL